LRGTSKIFYLLLAIYSNMFFYSFEGGGGGGVVPSAAGAGVLAGGTPAGSSPRWEIFKHAAILSTQRKTKVFLFIR
jgi:hypothetical protein